MIKYIRVPTVGCGIDPPGLGVGGGRRIKLSGYLHGHVLTSAHQAIRAAPDELLLDQELWLNPGLNRRAILAAALSFGDQCAPMKEPSVASLKSGAFTRSHLDQRSQATGIDDFTKQPNPM